MLAHLKTGWCTKRSSPTPLWRHRLPVTALALLAHRSCGPARSARGLDKAQPPIAGVVILKGAHFDSTFSVWVDVAHSSPFLYRGLGVKDDSARSNEDANGDWFSCSTCDLGQVFFFNKCYLSSSSDWSITWSNKRYSKKISVCTNL